VPQTDGIARIYGYYRLPDYGLILTAGFTLENLLAPYYRQRAWIIAAALALSLALLIAVFAAVREIGDRERRARELLEANSELEQGVQSRTRELKRSTADMESFSYSVAHDLKGPLRAITSFASLLREEYAATLAPEGLAMLARIRAGALHMNDLLDGLLALSRLSRQQLHLDQVDLSQIAREVAAGLEAQHPGRKVRCAIEEDLRARADARLMRIALTNLMQGAWKTSASPAGAGVELRRGPIPRSFMICDNGAGLDTEHSAQQFALLGRLPGAGEHEGSGIALATTKRIMERQGGRVWTESSPGAGARFYFTLDESAVAA
jgi:light-regulated signal transduction histidine kinase (bacteriophytochrome)